MFDRRTTISATSLILAAGAASGQCPLGAIFSDNEIISSIGYRLNLDLISIADVDHDGHADIIGIDDIDPQDPAVVIARGSSNGTFPSATRHPIPNAATRGLAVADLDGDGLLDILTSGAVDSVSIMHGQPGALPAGPVPVALPPLGIDGQGIWPEIADFDSDGILDLALLYEGGLNRIVVFWGSNGASIFESFTTVTVDRPWTIDSADISGNGLPDLTTGGVNPQSRCRSWFSNNGERGFRLEFPNEVCATSTPTAVALGDLNGDGLADAFRSGYPVTPSQVAFNVGGDFWPNPSFLPLGFNTTSRPAVADLDADGIDDLVLTGGLNQDGSRALVIARGSGNSVLVIDDAYSTRGFSRFTGSGDVDADGRPDAILFGSEDGGATTTAYVSLNQCIPSPCTADLAPPAGVLDLADIAAFVAGFTAADPIADLAPDGVFDLADIAAFVTSFNAGCP